MFEWGIGTSVPARTREYPISISPTEVTSSRGTLGLRRRLRYLANRVIALDIASLWRVAGQIAHSARRPRLVILVDMLWCAVAYESGFQDYLDWDFHLLTRRQRKTYMTHPKSNHLAQKLNVREYRSLFANKTEFNRHFGAWVGRDWLDVRTTTTDELKEFVLRHGRVMVKVADSIGGEGIEKREAGDVVDWDAFRAELLGKRQFLVEEFLVQHETMATLSPSSVNTLRVITFFDGTRVHILARVLKMGNGGDVDNFSHGGMYTMLDERGVARHPAFDGTGATFPRHPLTGVDIVDFAVPLYEEVLTLVEEVARVVPQIPYVGWDIAITPDGPVVIEGNYNTGVFQLKPSTSGVKTGLLPVYKAAIGF